MLFRSRTYESNGASFLEVKTRRGDHTVKDRLPGLHLHNGRLDDDGAAIVSPAAGREVLSESERAEEDVMLGIRLAEGIEVPRGVSPAVVAGFIADGLVVPAVALRGRLVLTLKGRLLADTVTRKLWDAQDL